MIISLLVLGVIITTVGIKVKNFRLSERMRRRTLRRNRR